MIISKSYLNLNFIFPLIALFFWMLVLPKNIFAHPICTDAGGTCMAFNRCEAGPNCFDSTIDYHTGISYDLCNNGDWCSDPVGLLIEASQAMPNCDSTTLYRVDQNQTCYITVGGTADTWCKQECWSGNNSTPPWSGGAPCTSNRIAQYNECELNANFGECGYYDNYYNGPDMTQVNEYDCGGYIHYECNNDFADICNQELSGFVYLDNNRNGVYDAGDVKVGSSLQTTISFDAHPAFVHASFARTTDSSGNFSIGPYTSDNTAPYSEVVGGDFTVTASGIPAGYIATSTNPISDTVDWNNHSGNVPLEFGIARLSYTVSGAVYTDYNHDKVWNGNDAAYTNSIITVNAVNSSGTTVASTTTSNGSYSLTLNGGNKYTIEIDVPSGYQQTNINPVLDFTNGGADTSGQNIGITPLYAISGLIYNDVNLNGKYDAGTDTLYTGSTTIHVSGGPSSVADMTQSTGTYNTGKALESGAYTVALTSSLPAGYSTKTPTSWNVTVGDLAGSTYLCSVGGSPDAQCDPLGSGSNGIINLDFGVTNESSWPIGCGDIRNDSGYAQLIPSTASCNGTAAPYAIINSAQAPYCPNTTSVLFSGNTDPTYGTGLGASTSNIVVGSSLFPELFNYRLPNTSDTSYDFVNTTLNNLITAPVSLTSICPVLTNCVLSENTPGGVYTTKATDGPVSISISNSDGSYDLGKSNYTFNIGGDLTFASDVTMQTGYSAAFISGEDIHAASNVGETDWTSTQPDLEGFFIAGGNFILDHDTSTGTTCQANGQPIDRKLNIVGSVITNANGTGGTLVNNREGCSEDLSCPTVTFTVSPNQILNAPNPLKPGYSVWQELNP